jgi:hypothetical protein
MVDAVRTRYVAECFWAGVRERDLRELDRRIAGLVAGAPVRYLGWLHVLDDEVVLLLFEGPIAIVRRVTERAKVPFDRLLRVAYAPRPHLTTDEEERQ